MSFFFYTKVPLTLEEFETLQQRIVEKAEQLPEGMHFILGSFAVKTDDDCVANVTPHIQTGKPPVFHFILKNYTSTIDYMYEEIKPSVEAQTISLQPFNKYSSQQSPVIHLMGRPHAFTLNNLVHCQTLGGTPFITVVDICVDHTYGVGLANVEALLDEALDYTQAISHVLISNTSEKYFAHALEPLMQVDPRISLQQCKQDTKQALMSLSLPFGQFKNFIIRLDPKPCLSLIDALNQRGRVNAEFKQETLKVTQIFEGLRFGEQDEIIQHLINKTWEDYKQVHSYPKKEKFLAALHDLVIKLKSDPIMTEIRTKLEAMKQGTAFFDDRAKKQITQIEHILCQLSIEERCEFKNSASCSKIINRLSDLGIQLETIEALGNTKREFKP